MSFIKFDFEKLSRDNRIKKVLYVIKELLNGKKELIYANDILIWLNELENFNFSIPENNNDWEKIFLKLYEILKSENPFIEDEPFDKTTSLGKLIRIKVLLEDIRSPFNAGSILRTCECFGVEEVILTGITPNPENNVKVNKTAMGVKINCSYNKNTEEAILNLKNNGYKIYSIEKTKNSSNIDNALFDFPALLIFGNEEFGISKNTLKLSDNIFHIEMLGLKNSLNVTIACGIALYEAVKIFKV